MLNKKIYILCDHGLGNRFGSIIGGLRIAELTNSEPIICWPKNNWCQCDYEDLFEHKFKVETNDFSLFLVNKIQEYQLPYFFLGSFNNDLSKKIYGYTIQEINELNQHNSHLFYSNCKIPKTDMISKTDVIRLLSSIIIKKEILTEVKNFCKKNFINRATIGIHLRKTDTPKTADENCIFDEIKNTPSINYFLCSDNDETEAKFKTLPNVKIFQKQSKVFKIIEGDWRQSVVDQQGNNFLFNINRPKEQIIDALIDLLILSRTNIQRKSKSTFCTIAEKFAQLEFI